jgi:alpha-ribazole phosphatase/probable phosphoglycerate mutase
MITTIDLLRHGEPLGGRRYRGQVDDPLSEKGWDDMWYAVSGEPPWQNIISSPLRRCSEFAQALSNRTGIPLRHDERFKELGFGDWEGKSSEQIRALDAHSISRFYHDPIKYRPHGAEALEQFYQRVNSALNDSIIRHPGQHLLIVCHAGVIRAILTRVLSAPLKCMYRITIATASMSRLQLDEEKPLTLVFHGRQRPLAEM